MDTSQWYPRTFHCFPEVKWKWYSAPCRLNINIFCLCAYVCAGVFICTCVWRSKLNVEGLPLSFPSLFFETGSLTKPEATYSARLTGTCLTPFPHTLGAGVIVICLGSWLSQGCLGSKHRSLCLHGNPFTHWAIAPIQFVSFLLDRQS